jgi:flagellar basal body-associated protein FliL
MYTQIIQTIVIIIIAAVCVIVPMYFAFQAESKKQAKKA